MTDENAGGPAQPPWRDLMGWFNQQPKAGKIGFVLSTTLVVLLVVGAIIGAALGGSGGGMSPQESAQHKSFDEKQLAVLAEHCLYHVEKASKCWELTQSECDTYGDRADESTRIQACEEVTPTQREREEETQQRRTPLEEQVDHANEQAQAEHENAEAEANSRLKSECGRPQIEAENVSGDRGPCGQIAIEANGGERR